MYTTTPMFLQIHSKGFKYLCSQNVSTNFIHQKNFPEFLIYLLKTSKDFLFLLKTPYPPQKKKGLKIANIDIICCSVQFMIKQSSHSNISFFIFAGNIRTASFVISPGIHKWQNICNSVSVSSSYNLWALIPYFKSTV